MALIGITVPEDQHQEILQKYVLHVWAWSLLSYVKVYKVYNEPDREERRLYENENPDLSSPSIRRIPRN